jgi:hypothetical protein
MTSNEDREASTSGSADERSTLRNLHALLFAAADIGIAMGAGFPSS